MIKPKKPEWEITMRHAGNVVMGGPLAVVALIVWKLSFLRLISSTVGLTFFAVTAIVFSVVFYSILEWYWNIPSAHRLSSRTRTAFPGLRRPSGRAKS